MEYYTIPLIVCGVILTIALNPSPHYNYIVWDWYAEHIINTLLCSLYRSVGGLNGMLPTHTHTHVA